MSPDSFALSTPCTVYEWKQPASEAISSISWNLCACVHICLLKGGKAQIIGPEEEDEEDDGYAFNEVRMLSFIFKSSPPSVHHLAVPSICTSIHFSFFFSVFV